MIYFSNIGFYKANMKLSKLRKVLTSSRKQHKKLFVALSTLSFILFLYLTGVIFGIDKILIETPVEGRVTSSDGSFIPDAEVILQGNKTKTDDKGYFKFEDVDFGTYEIVIDKNGYVRHSDNIKIRRFSNSLNISLKPQEYGEVKIVFKTERALDKDINVKINAQPFVVQTLNEEFIVETGRLLVGNYLLEFSSPDFVDFSEKFNLLSGNSEIVYNLVPSGDLVAEFRDYLSESIIEPEEVAVFLEGEEIEMSDMETPGKFELKDIVIDKEYTITSKLTGFIYREVKIKPEQGLNSLGNVYMFPDDNVIFTEDSLIVSSYLDGTNRKELYNAKNKCNVVKTKAQYTLFACGSNFLLYEKSASDYKLIREYVITGGKYDLNTKNLQMLLLSNDLKSIQQVHSSINTSVLYTHNKEIDSIVVDKTGVIYFSDNEAIYMLQDNGVEKIIDGNYRLDMVTPDNNSILAYGNRTTNQSNIWRIDTKSRFATKITFLPNEYTDLDFEGTEVVYYVVNDALFSGSINNNNFKKITDDIDGYWLQEGSNFIPVQVDGSTHFVSKINYTKKPFYSEL